jgi:hypothetical protein
LLLFSVVLTATLIISFSIYFTVRKKKARLVTSVFLIVIATLGYPFFTPLFRALRGPEGIVSLMMFCLLLLLGGLITLIVGLFTGK